MAEEFHEVSHEDIYRELIRQSDVDIDPEVVVEAANRAFDEVAGLVDGAAQVWTDTTLPQVRKVYEGNPLKLGRKLLEIIDGAGAQHGVEATIGYLSTAVSLDEVAFSEVNKEAHAQKLVRDIEDFIVAYAERYGADNKGVVAVVLWGSYARHQQRLGSDIDLSFITKDDPMGFADGDKWVHTDEFEELLQQRLDNDRGYSVDMQNWGVGTLSDVRSIRDIIDLDTPAFLVASPYPEVKDTVQKLLEAEVAKKI